MINMLYICKIAHYYLLLKVEKIKKSNRKLMVDALLRFAIIVISVITPASL